jgi:hypothetical protein
MTSFNQRTQRQNFEQKITARRSRNHIWRLYRRVGVSACRRVGVSACRRGKAAFAREESSRKCAKFNVSTTEIQFKSANGSEAASRAGAINQSRSAANRARELRLGLRDGCRRHRVSRLRFVHLDSNGRRPLKNSARQPKNEKRNVTTLCFVILPGPKIRLDLWIRTSNLNTELIGTSSKIMSRSKRCKATRRSVELSAT